VEMRIKRHNSSHNEGEDVTVKCDLKDHKSLTIVNYRNMALKVDESALFVHSNVEEEEEDELLLLAIPITAGMKVEFVEGGVFAVTPSVKTDLKLHFHTLSLHQMWEAVATLDENLKSAIFERTNHSEGRFHWLAAHLSDGFVHKDCIYLLNDRVERYFEAPRALSPAAPLTGHFSKPDVDEVRAAIEHYIRSVPDPDELAPEDVVVFLKSKFGEPILGKYGFHKALIQQWTFEFYGRLEKPSKIHENLYLGSEFNAGNKSELHSLGITHILNVTTEVPQFFPKDFIYHQVPVLDVPQAQLTVYVERALSFIDAGVKRGAVLVHCQRGVSRSATFVIAYMMFITKVSLADAIKFVKERRRIVKPNTGFVAILKSLEDSWKLKGPDLDLSFYTISVSQRSSQIEAKQNTYKQKSSKAKAVKDTTQGTKAAIFVHTMRYSVYIIGNID